MDGKCRSDGDTSTSDSIGISSSSEAVYTVGGTLTRPKSRPKSVTTSDTSGDTGRSTRGSIDFSSSRSSIHHSKYEWDKSLAVGEKYLVFKFMVEDDDNFCTNKSSNSNAELLGKHGATLPYMNKQAGYMYSQKYMPFFDYKVQTHTAMTHFLLMMDLGEEEEKIRDADKKEKEKRKCKKKQLHRVPDTNMMKTEAGVNVACVTSLKSIYNIESVSSKSFTEYENIILEDSQIQLVLFLKMVLIDDTANKDHKHFMNILCSKIYKDGKFTYFWQEKKAEYKKKDNNELVTIVAMRLEKFASTRNHTSFNEKDLQSFLLLLLNDFNLSGQEPNKIKSFSDVAATIEITQLRREKSESKMQSQKTSPDVEYWEQDSLWKIIKVLQILICELKAPTESTSENWKSPMETEMYKGSLLSAKVKCTLLWQIYEAIFGTMMKSKHGEEMMDKNHVVFQGGMLVCNDRVRSVVLAMNAKLYSEMRQKTCARETFMWIKENLMWARLYIEAHDHHILDALYRTKFTHNNFCKCVPSKGEHAILL